MKRFFVLPAILVLAFLGTSIVLAHCDTMNGPVVKAAKKALETGNVNLVLIWIQPKNEPLIKDAFERTMKVRSVSPEVGDMADMYFFETLVRIHRAGEGEPYTGLKQADTEVDPGIEAADQAIEQGTTGVLIKQMKETIDTGISEHFKEVLEAKRYGQNDLTAGRRYVKSYVTFIHYVERLYESATKPIEEH